MSKKACDLVIKSLMRDAQFKKEFGEAPEATLDAFLLTTEERAQLLALNLDQLSASADKIIESRREAGSGSAIA